MLIKNVRYKDWNDNLDVNSKWKPQVSADFVDEVVAAFAASKPIKDRESGLYSMKLTMQNIVNTKADIGSTSKNKMDWNNFSELVVFMYKVNRSVILKVNQNQNPKYGQLTPLFLYAHKFYNDIPYEMWDKKDSAIHFALGKNLNPVLSYKPVGDFDLVEIRKDALTENTTGQLKPLISNKMNIKEINGIKVPKCALFMLLQTWICNASIRNTESMILDPENWDRIPDALDAEVPKERKKEGVSTLEIPWL
jgi:hypothetical protein